MAKLQYRRTLTSKKTMLETMLSQKCRCAYCNRPLLGLTLAWDHVIPFAYQASRDDNWAASCAECNLKKSSKVFNEELLEKFIYERISWSHDFGEDSPEGHEEYWKRQWDFEKPEERLKRYRRNLTTPNP